MREDNQIAGYSWAMTYDNAGNMTSRKKYSYTTGTLGAVLLTQVFTYGKDGWGDVLAKINTTNVLSDAVGNIQSDGTSYYTWKNGRQLATATKGGTTWTFTYDASGLRTERTSGYTTYTYIYDGSTLSQMTMNGIPMHFTYGVNGQPISINYNGTEYYYITNAQGDVVGILNSSGAEVVSYVYDAWGSIVSISGSMAGALGIYNPIRYRGYVYDQETGLYYLQSRYYNPAIGRFISADSFVSTGQDILGYNMFAYCANNPIAYTDPTGCIPKIYNCLDAGGGYGANTEHLMAFFGVTSPNEIPKMPDGAMIFVENITGITILGLTFIKGSTIVFDEYKYCEYSFTGIGIGAGVSLPLDKTITQGYVYGVNDVADYCGEFWSGSLCCAATAIGGAYAFGGVRGEITAGMSTSVSLGVSRTYYITPQTDWIYGKANLTFVPNSVQPPLSYLPRSVSIFA